MPRGRKTVTPGHKKVTPRAQKGAPGAQKGAPGGAGSIPSVGLTISCKNWWKEGERSQNKILTIENKMVRE